MYISIYMKSHAIYVILYKIISLKKTKVYYMDKRQISLIDVIIQKNI